MNIKPIFDKLQVVVPPEDMSATVKRVLTNLSALETFDMSTVIVDKDADDVGTGDKFRIKKASNDKISLIPEKLYYADNMGSILYGDIKWKDGTGFTSALTKAGDTVNTTIILSPKYKSDDTLFDDKITMNWALGLGNPDDPENVSVVNFFKEGEAPVSTKAISFNGAALEFDITVTYPFDPAKFIASTTYTFDKYLMQAGDITSIAAYKFNMGVVDFISAEGKSVTTTIDLENL